MRKINLLDVIFSAAENPECVTKMVKYAAGISRTLAWHIKSDDVIETENAFGETDYIPLRQPSTVFSNNILSYANSHLREKFQKFYER